MAACENKRFYCSMISFQSHPLDQTFGSEKVKTCEWWEIQTEFERCHTGASSWQIRGKANRNPTVMGASQTQWGKSHSTLPPKPFFSPALILPFKILKTHHIFLLHGMVEKSPSYNHREVLESKAIQKLKSWNSVRLFVRDHFNINTIPESCQEM